MISVERLGSIAHIDRSEWDRLAGDNVFASWGWLRTVEETSRHAGDRAYFVARNSEGLVAASPCHFEGDRTPLAGIDLALFGRFTKLARRLGLGTRPALICGGHTGPSQHVLVRADKPAHERAALVLTVVEELEAAAARDGATLCFRNMVEDQSPLAAILRARHYLRAAELPTTYLDVKWTSFEQYVRDLKARHPSTARNIAHEQNRARRSGLSFQRPTDPGPREDRLHGLLDRHYRRLNSEPFPYRPHFLSTLKRYLGERVVLYTAVKDEELISIVVGVRGGEALFLIMVGKDDTKGRDGFVYFNNSYNEPIRDAIAAGVRRIYSGKLVYDVKQRRGFELLGLDLYLRVPGGLHSAALRPVLACQWALVRSRMVRSTSPLASDRSP